MTPISALMCKHGAEVDINQASKEVRETLSHLLYE
jgi:hypothetical protein